MKSRMSKTEFKGGINWGVRRFLPPLLNYIKTSEEKQTPNNTERFH